MKKLLIIHTGGTISMVENKKTGEVNKQGEHPLANISKQLDMEINMEEKILFDLPSPQITPQHMLQLAKFIKKESNQYHGMIITHGTDTLEETAFFLDLSLDLTIPVIVTGAMRPSNEIGSDALYNLLSSVRVAMHDEAKYKGVLVVMNDEIHTPDDVTKTSTSNIATFQSPQFGPIGIITKSNVIFYRTRTRRNLFNVININHSVYLLKAYTGMDATLLDAIHKAKPNGIVIEALGIGNLPKETIPYIKAMLDENISIVITSRSFTGHVQPIYSYDGGGRQLEKLGAIFAGGLSGPKARIKLLLALEKTNKRDELKKIMEH